MAQKGVQTKSKQHTNIFGLINWVLGTSFSMVYGRQETDAKLCLIKDKVIINANLNE